MNADVRNADTIFAQAIEIESPQERAVFLEQACANDPELRREMEKLVGDYFRAGAFLERPAAHIVTTLDVPLAERPGTVIGPYKLREQIGEGGMGLVFVAEQQQPVRRKVALKVIKPGMDSKQVIARFEAERQALALMDHPNIAKVLDAGTTESGRPYFVMELVKGVPITAYCDQNRLPTRQRLELFVPVCQAVQHAHQKGVIHRDLKPSNVLVAVHDVTPVPKVIDFGLAKAMGHQLTEQTLYTGIGHMVGTPLYMSPEQAGLSSLDVDTRSDIYSLGVLLYELLTGLTPFDQETLRQAGFDELRRIIREDEPPRPSTRLSTLAKGKLSTICECRGVEPGKLGQQVRGELDWIVMKALEKDRNRRYESASAFAVDVQRYLHDEPVQACPPSAWYKLRKFARRRKAPLMVAACVLLAVTVFAITVGWFLREQASRQTQVEGEARLALRDAELLQKQKKWSEAAAAAQRAHGLLRAGPTDEALQRLVEERVADLTLAAQLDQILTDRLVRLAERHWETLSDPEIDARYARAFQEAGIDVQALDVATAAEKIRRRGIRAELATALDDWTATRHNTAGKKDQFWRQLLELANAVDPDPFRMQLRKAWAEFTGDDTKKILAAPELLDQPMAVLNSLAAPVLIFERKGQAWQEVLRAIHRRRPGDFWINFELGSSGASSPVEALRYSAAAVALRPENAGARLALGRALEKLGRHDEALAELREALRLHPERAQTYIQLAGVLEAKGLLDEALSAFREALRLAPRNAYAHNGVGTVLANQGKLDEAIPSFQEAIRLKPNYPEAHNNLGAALKLQGRFAEAIKHLREAVRLQPDYANAHYNLGGALADQGKRDEAIATYREAIRLKPDFAYAHCRLGLVLAQQGKLDEAIACFKEAVRLQPEFAESHYYLGIALNNQGKWAEAIAAYQEAIRLKPDHALARNNLAWLLATCPDAPLRDPRQAVLHASKAVELTPDNAGRWNTLGVAQYRNGAWKAAVEALTKSVQLSKGGDSSDFFFLAMAYWQLDEKEQARTWYDQAVQWMAKNKPRDEELHRLRAEAAELLGIPEAAAEQKDKK
jgi:tetratricopeptide (TPR) repeat protein